MSSSADQIQNFMARFQPLTTPHAPVGSSVIPNFNPINNPVSVGGTGPNPDPSTAGITPATTNPFGFIPSSLSPTLLFTGFSWGRVGAFLIGLIALLVGLYLFKPTQQFVQPIIGKAKDAAKAAVA